MTKVLICVQARSTSERLPNKALKMMAGKPAILYVLDPCQYVSVYMRRDCEKLGAEIQVCLAVPKGDPLVANFSGMVDVVEGDEKDVLSRFVQAADQFDAEYIVRVTGDCVRIQTHIISRHIKAALIKDRDYVTNTWYRTYQEGWDCEVISRRLLDWLDKNATNPKDREHVTSLIGPTRVFPFADSDGKKNVCHILNPDDESEKTCPHCQKAFQVKTSVDTDAEFDAAEQAILRAKRIKNDARRNGIVYI